MREKRGQPTPTCFVPFCHIRLGISMNRKLMTDRQNDSKKTQLTYLGSDRKALYFHDEGSRAYWESALFSLPS